MTDHNDLCQALVAQLGADKVIFPDSAGYEASLLSYFNPQTSATRPLCFVTPKTTDDVVAVVKSLTANGSCHFAVRSGGHMWLSDASNVSGGVTIDLRGLNSVDLSADKSTVSVGIGATWDAVYTKLDPLGLSVAGGRVAGVGVGGLTLGGGVSYFGPRYGWTCDQATSFEVVLADGSVVEASEKQNADLWWGLRGGLNNFSIVTRVDLTTFEQGLLWYTTSFHPLSVLDDQIKIYAKLMAAENYDENASFLTGWGYSNARGLCVALSQLIYTKAEEGSGTPAFYQEAMNIPTITQIPVTTTIAPMTTLAIQSVELQKAQAARYLNATTTFVPTAAMIRAAYDAFDSSTKSLAHITGLRWAVSLEPLPPQIYARRAADNAMGLADRKDALVICLLSPAWQDAAHDEEVYAAARALVKDIDERAKALGAYDPYIYPNYAAPWQEVIASYGEASVKRLQQLRARVDPNEVFTRQVPGGFKVPS